MKNKKLWFLVPLLVLVIIGLYLASLKIQLIRDDYSQTISKLQNQLTEAKKEPTNESKFNYWEIYDTTQSPIYSTGLKFYENDLQAKTVARWGDFLIGLNVEPYLGLAGRGSFNPNPNTVYQILKTIRTIRVFDIKTSQTFDISLDKPIYGDFWYMASQVVGNKFYFGVGGAFGPSLGYKLDLPPQRTSKIIKMKSTIGNEIKVSGDVLISTFCYEGCSFSLFNQQTEKETPLPRLLAANNDRSDKRSEIFIGMDNQGNEIMNVLDTPMYSSSSAIPSTKKIVAVSAKNEKSEKIILTASQLPAGVKYFMNWNTHTILMVGPSVIYTYNISNNKFTYIEISANYLEQYRNAFPLLGNTLSKNNRFICFGEEHKKIVIDIEKNIISGDQSVCRDSSSPTAEDLFKDLNLPENFQLFYTGLKYSPL